MTVSKQWLENKIKELNDWLIKNEKTNHFEYAPKKQNRDSRLRLGFMGNHPFSTRFF